ncbi:MAG: hypothetical protein LBK02_08790 [Treponema sp.]|nr:hypothetical protein [Treponema sp.]
MATLLITFGVILVVVGLMSVGVIFGRKPISGGSCCDKAGPDAGCAGCEKNGKNGPPCPVA